MSPVALVRTSALGLPKRERAQLACALLEGLDADTPPAAEVGQAWTAAITRRAGAIADDTAKTVDARVHALLARRKEPERKR